MTDTARLLVVDDEPLRRDMLEQHLVRQGYGVQSVGSAKEGLDAIAHRQFDLVLIEAQMPGMSGLDMLKAIRITKSAAQLPVIMVTAKSRPEDVVEALELGANDYITSPFDLPVALARIRSQVANRRTERAMMQSQERYELAVRGTNDGVWDWDIDANKAFFSPRWHELMGSPAAESVGTLDTWLSCVHAEDLPGVRTALDAHLAGQTEIFESEHRIRRHDGRFGWMLARGRAVRNADGRAVRMAGSLTDITEAKVADPLTSLPNRVLFMDRMARLFERRARFPEFTFALLFIAVDHLQTINDGLGHHAGDALLIDVARRLDAGLRTTDLVSRVDAGWHNAGVAGHTLARMGGDEFAILLGGTRHQSDAITVANRISRLLQEPFRVGDQEVFVSASIGIAISGPGTGNPHEMIRHADTALSKAKAQGRGYFEVYDQSMHADALARLTGETELRRALERGEFVVYYQPIVELSSGKVTSLEALVRWQHPERGMVGAAEFIPLAEESRLIVSLGMYVFECVCRQIQEWSRVFDNSTTLPRVAINVSARQLAIPDLAERFLAMTRKYAVTPQQIEIELTESAMMADHGSARVVVGRLREAGFRVSIDDFGTGYSSLAYLRTFPVDKLKLDKSFISSGDGDSNNAGIVRAVVDLARHLNMEVVAEGVETEDQARELQALNCAYGQGYYFLKPATSSRITRMLTGEEPVQAATELQDRPAPTTRRDEPAA